MSAHKRVVITGLGATTPVGGTAPETWDALLAGESGARPLPPEWLERYELPVTFAASLKQDPSEVLPKVEIRRADPFAQYAMIASREAWKDAGEPDVEPERLLAAIGTGIGGVHTLLAQYDVLKEKGPRRVYPLTVPMLMPNAASGNVSLEFKARAGAHTAVSACASGAESMGMAANMIREGRADVAIAGGTEAAIHPLPIAGFAAAHALSRRNDDPTGASRPWAVDRDGFLLGEGAGVVILESYEHATARGAKIYAEFAGLGMSADAYHITAGDPEGASQARAMNEAIAEAGLQPSDISHVNAHATSTPIGDAAEIVSLKRAFGDHVENVALTGTKSMTGHLLGAAGAIEAVILAQTVHQRMIPRTINVQQVDPEIDLDLVIDDNRALPEGDVAAMSNAFGFGGHNIAIVLKSV
ncbi:3-oxoacyl-[acyl-carrier-protein] synthase 2 [Flexivirga endophytica]|uniref:3-oxoacyl-[acyl-carrier-protein] synthase 2 n=1 Tax=Flexivirga endophytica TaxID=1849103 RepID=A0A916TDT7_9MICO|nr:beta-ketoacyl-ACP synthase II [Flexivirga endophytica]GGB41553.1 3-oxoacyl-[acyl-carrier-protein] synthase 2 [Flexivirga endophytica]GHB49388.1 3-oxoacyl-[acyl-carrier-protein] synthase 2 [Flexivirga endophytica]